MNVKTTNSTQRKHTSSHRVCMYSFRTVCIRAVNRWDHAFLRLFGMSNGTFFRFLSGRKKFIYVPWRKIRFPKPSSFLRRATDPTFASRVHTRVRGKRGLVIFHKPYPRLNPWAHVVTFQMTTTCVMILSFRRDTKDVSRLGKHERLTRIHTKNVKPYRSRVPLFKQYTNLKTTTRINWPACLPRTKNNIIFLFKKHPVHRICYNKLACVCVWCTSTPVGDSTA